jgi:outer membrane protein assembly factor BamB
MRWKTGVSAGHSSPVIWGDRIFLTGFDAAEKKLELICVNRKNGKVLWRTAAPCPQIEKVHKVSNPATATPAVDADRVYAYFGSGGLFAYAHDGKPAWSLPMPPASVAFGSGTSPILFGDSVLLLLDHGKERKMLAVDRKSGKVSREIDVNPDKLPGMDGHSSPVIAGGLVVLHRPSEVAAFDPGDGARKWRVSVFTQGTGTPVAASGIVYVPAWHNIGDSDFLTPPKWEDMTKYDKDSDGELTAAELPADLYIAIRPEAGNIEGANITVRFVLGMADGNKDGKLSKAEYESVVKMATAMRQDHGLLAIRTGGAGDVTRSHVLWTEKKSVPEVPAPLIHRGRLYMVTNGGVVTCMDAKTGKAVYRGRLGAGGMYFSSPVAAGDYVYFASGDGMVSVLKPADTLQVAARNDLGEPIFATPAVAGKTLYVRTANNLYAFAK